MLKPANNRVAGNASALAGASVIVVDDEKHIRLMLRTLLEAEGSKVAESENGQQAMQLIQAQAFDIMLLDLNMPVMDGLAILDQLKREPPKNSPRVIVLTAYGSIPAAVHATRAGALDFLEKPASPDEVREAINAVLHQPQPAHANPVEADTEGGYETILMRVRKALRQSDVAVAESLLMKAADISHHDAAYFNLLGVLYEIRRQWRLAKKFYGKAIRTNRHYDAAQQNLRRIYELDTYGRSREPVALGDEAGTSSGALNELLREQRHEQHGKPK